MGNIFPFRFHTSLRFRLYVYFSAAIGALSLFIFIYFPQKYNEQALTSARNKAISIAELSAVSVAMPLYVNDKEGIENVFESIRHNSDLSFIMLVNDKQELIAGHNVEAAIGCKYLEATENGVIVPERRILMTKVPIKFEANIVGSIYVGFALDSIFLEINETKDTIALISGLIFLTGLILVYIMTVIVTRPIEKMANTFQQVVQGNFSQHMTPSGYDEIDRLGKSFNQMVDELAAVQAELHSINRTLELRVNERTIDLQREIQHHKKTELALRESEERFRALVELSPAAIVVFTDGKYFYINSAILSIFRISSFEIIQEKVLTDFMGNTQTKQFNEMLHQILYGTTVNVHSEFIFHRDDGSEFIAEVTAIKLIYQGKDSVQILIRDISERIKNERQRLELEQQLLHVQKKEIIGTLASGIAHDILNILGIIGTAINKLLFLKSIDEKSLMDSAEQISKATDRGKALVKQLLTFAKKTELNFDVTQVNAPVSEIINVIQRTFPNTIFIKTHLSENLPLIRADNNQLHQALLNLCLNARDAIQEKGKITIETSVKNALRMNGSITTNGEYICISVSDTGIGMNNDVLKKIYEPFFTTKSEGTGSGLGLAMVKGIVENHKGFIEVESELGKGTTFRLYFPI
ncbi:MAG: ATP-binding protein [Bacteroidota bacterium]